MYYFYFTVSSSDFAGGGFQKWAKNKEIDVMDDGKFSGNGFSGYIEPEDNKIKIVFTEKPLGLQEEVFVTAIKEYLKG